MRDDSLQSDLTRIVSVDVETSGSHPSEYALLSIGACTLFQPRQIFYAELIPDRALEDPDAMAVHNLHLDNLRVKGRHPTEALREFNRWLQLAIPNGQKPLFMGFNAPFDWMFVNDYFLRYMDDNPFGHSALDIKSFLMGFRRIPWSQTSMRMLTDDPLHHNALADAEAQADIFLDILKSDGVLSDNT